MVRLDESDPREFGKDHGLISEAIVTGRKVGAGRKFWAGLAHDKPFFQEVVWLGIKHGHHDGLVKDMFVLPEVQVEIARHLNEKRQWGFTAGDFAALLAEGQVPRWPNGDLQAIVLDISLDSVQATFDEAWYCHKLFEPESWRWYYTRSDAEHLRLIEGLTHQRGLRWQVIDFGCHRNRRPVDVRNPKNSPSSAVLWAGVYFPRWVRAQKSPSRVPYTLISGYELSIPDVVGSEGSFWTYVPQFHWDIKGARLGGIEKYHCDKYRAVPKIIG